MFLCVQMESLQVSCMRIINCEYGGEESPGLTTAALAQGRGRLGMGCPCRKQAQGADIGRAAL